MQSQVNHLTTDSLEVLTQLKIQYWYLSYNIQVRECQMNYVKNIKSSVNKTILKTLERTEKALVSVIKWLNLLKLFIFQA